MSLICVFLTKLLTSGILFAMVVRAVVVAKLVILGISPSTSFVLALGKALVTSCILSSIFFILALYT